MKWRGRRTSANIEDRRADGAGPAAGRGPRIGLGLPRGGGGGGGRRAGGIGGLGAIAILLIGLYFGVDLTPLLGGGGAGFAVPGGEAAAPAGPNAIDDRTEEFVAVVLADTEEVWGELFAAQGQAYAPPVLVLFRGRTGSACGLAQAATGPFYCPGDRKVYLDTGFFEVLERRLGAGGDFARAYVIAHEVAHHVQNLVGTLPKVNASRARAGEAEANRLSVRVELQADCYSGVWARQAQARFGTLEPGDIEEALTAASAIGDDTLQRQGQGVVVPDSFTHGTSEQRMRWFETGYRSGDPGACDTFAAARL